MIVKINGQKKEFPDGQCLNGIIRHFTPNGKRVIAELNGTIIKSTQWADTLIKEGDMIELVNFVGGG
jgi:thiamine biosynthesis protein ThiS